MTLRGYLLFGTTTALAAALAGCAGPAAPPPPVAVTVPKPVPPVMPVGGYPGLAIAPKREDGTYITPNFQMTDAAAVWHLRGALNVAALGCDHAGGGVVDGYNAWLESHGPALNAYMKQYMHEWQVTGWSDWDTAYDNNLTRLYNFYSQSPIRSAFCAAARGEIAKVGAVADADLPAFARGSLTRLDKPFIDFFTAFDAWRAYYEPQKVTPPPVVATVPTTTAHAEGPMAHAGGPMAHADAPATTAAPAGPAAPARDDARPGPGT